MARQRRVLDKETRIGVKQYTMISKLLSAFPAGTRDKNELLDWCRRVKGQYSGDISTTVKSLLDIQEQAGSIAAEIKTTRDALLGICKKSSRETIAASKLSDIKAKIDTEKNRQSVTVPITEDKEVASCLKRYSESLACALALLEQPAPTQKKKSRKRKRKPASATATSDTQPLPELDDDAALAILNEKPAVTPSETSSGEVLLEEHKSKASDSSTAAAKSVRALTGGDQEKREALQELSRKKLEKSIAATIAADKKGGKPKKKSWLPWRRNK